MPVVPFLNWGVWGGLAICAGMLRRESDHLMIEFQVKAGLLGVLAAKVRTIRIPLADLITVDLVRGFHFNSLWINTRIAIETVNLEAVQDFPDMKHGRIELVIPRAGRAAAAEFLDELYRDMDGVEADEPPAASA